MSGGNIIDVYLGNLIMTQSTQSTYKDNIYANSTKNLFQ